jgi:hypothetical protein
LLSGSVLVVSVGVVVVSSVLSAPCLPVSMVFDYFLSRIIRRASESARAAIPQTRTRRSEQR